MASNRPPTAPNLDQIVNRIALGLNKQSRLLSTLNKHRQAGTSSQPSSSNPQTSGGFSSLAKSSTSATTPSFIAPSLSSTTKGKDDDDADLNPSIFQNPNAGVGWIHSSAAAASTSKEDRLLKSRLLGRGGARGHTSSNAQRKRAAGVDSESEEELGRSAVGKSKGKRTRIARGGNEDGPGENGRDSAEGIAEGKSPRLAFTEVDGDGIPADREVIRTSPGQNPEGNQQVAGGGDGENHEDGKEEGKNGNEAELVGGQGKPGEGEKGKKKKRKGKKSGRK